MKSYDVTVLTPGEVRVLHQDGPVTTDGPWLILYATSADYNAHEPSYVFPSDAVAGVEPCPGGDDCRGRSS